MFPRFHTAARSSQHRARHIVNQVAPLAGDRHVQRLLHRFRDIEKPLDRVEKRLLPPRDIGVWVAYVAHHESARQTSRQAGVCARPGCPHNAGYPLAACAAPAPASRNFEGTPPDAGNSVPPGGKARFQMPRREKTHPFSPRPPGSERNWKTQATAPFPPRAASVSRSRRFRGTAGCARCARGRS